MPRPPGHGGHHVRDRGPGGQEEREARGADPAGGGPQGSQAGHAGAHAGTVWTTDWYWACKVSFFSRDLKG